MGSDDIQVQFYLADGEVTLTCGDRAFDRLWSLVAEAAGPVDGAPAAVRVVVVERVPPAPPPHRWWRSLGALGCAVVGTVIVFIMVVGIGTIAGWVW